MSRKKLIVFGVLVVAMSVALLVLPIGDWITSFQQSVARLGPAGPVVAAAAYVPLTICLIPGSAVSIGVGTVYGFWTGLGIAFVGANLGAICTFLLARTLLRERVSAWAKTHPKFEALDRAIAREGFKMVLLARLSPVFPFTYLNYFLGLTSVSLRSYLLGNLIGMLPGTFLYVFLGASISSGIAADVSTLRIVLLLCGLVATVVVVLLIGRAARRAMAEIESGTSADEQSVVAAATT